MTTAPASPPPSPAASDWQKALKWAGFMKKGWVIITFIALIIFLVGYSLFSSSTPSKKSDGSLKEMINDLRYTKTFELEVATLEPHKLCGVRPGERKFTAPKKIPVIIGGNRHDLEEWILVNDTVAKEQFIVADDGCVKITFALVSNDKKKSIVPQIIPIKFE